MRVSVEIVSQFEFPSSIYASVTTEYSFNIHTVWALSVGHTTVIDYTTYTSPPCLNGWTHSLDACYRVTSDMISYDNATSACQAQYTLANMAWFENDKVFDGVKETVFGNQIYYVGMRVTAIDSVAWYNGIKPGADFTMPTAYTAKRCLGVSYTSKEWYTCDKQLQAVCRYDLPSNGVISVNITALPVRLPSNDIATAEVNITGATHIGVWFRGSENLFLAFRTAGAPFVELGFNVKGDATKHPWGCTAWSPNTGASSNIVRSGNCILMDPLPLDGLICVAWKYNKIRYDLPDTCSGNGAGTNIDMDTVIKVKARAVGPENGITIVAQYDGCEYLVPMTTTAAPTTTTNQTETGNLTTEYTTALPNATINTVLTAMPNGTINTGSPNVTSNETFNGPANVTSNETLTGPANASLPKVNGTSSFNITSMDETLTYLHTPQIIETSTVSNTLQINRTDSETMSTMKIINETVTLPTVSLITETLTSNLNESMISSSLHEHITQRSPAANATLPSIINSNPNLHESTTKNTTQGSPTKVQQDTIADLFTENSVTYQDIWSTISTTGNKEESEITVESRQDSFEPVLECGPPPFVVNANIELLETAFYSVVTYTCKIGHLMTNGQRSTSSLCDRGVWGNVPTTCNPIQCGASAFGDNINSECTHSEKYNDGSSLNTQRCTSLGVWSTPTGSCQSNRCSPLPFVKNSLPYDTKTDMGTSITIHCNPGYVLEEGGASVKVMCGYNLHWEPVHIGNCREAVCSDPPELNHTTIAHTATSYKLGDTVLYECTEGKLFDDGQREMVIECKGYELWNYTGFTCDANRCPVPPNIPGGKINSTLTFEGTVLQYKCNAGHIHTDGDTVLACTNRTWHGDWPVCEAVTCTVPPDVLWTRKINTNQVYTYTDEITYMCTRGYMFERGVVNMTAVCDENGNWTIPFEQCIETICGPLTKVVNAKYKTQTHNHYYNDRVPIVCELGYWFRDGVTTDVLTCDTDGTWNPLLKSGCEDRVECPALPVWLGADFETTSTEFDSKVKYTCNNDTSEVFTSWCSAHGVWEPPIQECPDLVDHIVIDPTDAERSSFIGAMFIVLISLAIAMVVGLDILSCVVTRGRDIIRAKDNIKSFFNGVQSAFGNSVSKDKLRNFNDLKVNSQVKTQNINRKLPTINEMTEPKIGAPQSSQYIKSQNQQGNAQDTSSNTRDAPSKSHDGPTFSKEATANSKDAPTIIKEASANPQDKAANSQDTAPNSQDAAPNSQETKPNSQDAAPNSQDAAPNSQDTAPNSQDAAPNSQDAAPNSQDAAPNSEARTANSHESTANSTAAISNAQAEHINSQGIDAQVDAPANTKGGLHDPMAAQEVANVLPTIDNTLQLV